ncbi:MAG TPA: AMP-binding protein [Candidatus Kryptonia bacterium]|nr:AMP-binding protein [Candidatus Kryptonia bacterium]
MAERQPDAIAVSWEGAGISFGELMERVRDAASSMSALGVKPGDRVAVGLANSPELMVVVLGVLESGGICVPLNPAYTGEEAGFIVSDSGARTVICEGALARALRQQRLNSVQIVEGLGGQKGNRGSVERTGEDPALIMYTSGTTGRPKGAVLSSRALLSNLRTVRDAWRWTARDRLLLTLPCFHLHGLALGILGSLLVGCEIVLRPRFVAEEIPVLIAGHRATLFFGVPTMYNRLVALPENSSRGYDLSSMRLWVSGSAPLTAATFERFRGRFGHAILERFGMSEGGFMIAAPYDEPRRPGVVGRPLPEIEVRIVDPEAADAGQLRDVADGEQGELVIRGPNLFSGYWNRPDETARAFVAGYFRSGDLAVRDPDGMIRITGRSSVDIIKTRGFKISAVEIENQLQSHPGVREVAVVGVPDPDQGERVVAVLTIAPDGDVTAESLRAFASERLAPHKIPAEFRFVAEIPSTGPGKFSKRRIIEDLTVGHYRDH